MHVCTGGQHYVYRIAFSDNLAQAINNLLYHRDLHVVSVRVSPVFRMRLRALASQRGLIQQPRVAQRSFGAAGGRPGEWAGPHGGTGSAVDDTPDADTVHVRHL